MTLFEAWCFPPGFVPESGEEGVLDGAPYPPFRCVSLSPERVRELCALLRMRDQGLRSYSVEEVMGVVDGVARSLLDPDDPLRRQALDGLEAQAGFSRPMARAVLDGMARDWTRERLRMLLEGEFGDPGVLEGFRPGTGGGQIRAVGYPLAFHLGAGTVPGVAVTSLIRGLLVRSAVLLKPGRGDPVLPVLFVRALAERAPDLARSVAVAYWPVGEGEATETALGQVDLAVVYGGDETVRWVRERLPVTTPLVAYRHRLGVGLVGRNALTAAPGREGEGGAEHAAREAARAVALFDQRGCVSPHLFLVEEGGPVSPDRWAELLALALDAMEGEIPSGLIPAREGVAVQQIREEGELAQASGEGVRVWHGGRTALWTVLFQRDGRLDASCLNRVVRVLPLAEMGEAPLRLAPWRGHLQTVGVVGLGEREGEIVEALAQLGVSRVASLAGAPWPPPWWHHDGGGPLRSLVRWTDWEGGES